MARWRLENGSAAGLGYAAFGGGERPLVILPGLSEALTEVEGKALLLAPGYRLFLEKYRVYFFGRRREFPAGFCIGDMAAEQAEAMGKLGLGGACVLGVSQGGMIAQLLAARYPEKVARLVIAFSAPCVNPLTAACLEGWMRFAAEGDHRALMLDTAEKSYSERYLKSFRLLYPVLGLLGRPKSYARFLAEVEAIHHFDARDELVHIAVPTLILGAAEDKIVGAAASQELHRLIPGSRLYLYPNLGHAAYEEAPDFERRVYHFLEM
ncbi:MAG: alpha/beta fold hydrolase [bacterium]